MNNPFDRFAKIVCLNLPRRTDRWAESLEEFKNLDIEVERIAAISHPHGPHGCSLSHLSAVRRYRHLDNLLIFEDDVTLKGDTSYLAEAFAALPEQWEVLFLGGLVFPDEVNTNKVAPHLHVAKNVVCCHAYVLSRLGMARMLREFAPMVAAGSRTPIDEYLRAVVQPSGTAFVLTPMIFDQRPSYSDTTHKPAAAHNLFSITNNKFQ
jgi:GR25 family glycosyltransferase involved in LPS biosynthesis